jgi:hypothetical protein
MLWSGYGEDEVYEAMSSPAILQSIEQQRTNGKTYIRIDLKPRKSNLDDFFVLCPKEYVPKVLPCRTRQMKGQGSQIIDGNDMQKRWRLAAIKVGIYQAGLGPHSMRAAFKTACDAVGVNPSASEQCLGHGGGDKFGYARPDEKFIADELRKLWNMTKLASVGAVDLVRQESEKMRELLTLIMQDTELTKYHDQIKATLAKPADTLGRAQKLSLRERNLQRELERVERELTENREKKKRLLKEMEIPK